MSTTTLINGKPFEWTTSYFGMGDGTSQTFWSIQDEDDEILGQVIDEMSGGWYVMLGDVEIAQVKTLDEGKELVELLLKNSTV